MRKQCTVQSNILENKRHALYGERERMRAGNEDSSSTPLLISFHLIFLVTCCTHLFLSVTGKVRSDNILLKSWLEVVVFHRCLMLFDEDNLQNAVEAEM